MKKIFITLMLALSLILCCGCFEAEVENEDDHFYCDTAIDELESKNEDLSERVADLEEQIAQMQSEIWDLQEGSVTYY